MTTLATVLVVDDEPHIRTLLRNTLVRASYAVVEAETARAARSSVLPGNRRAIRSGPIRSRC